MEIPILVPVGASHFAVQASVLYTRYALKTSNLDALTTLNTGHVWRAYQLSSTARRGLVKEQVAG